MLSIITGSQNYGQPTPESDVDLVIRCSETTKELLIEISDLKKMPIKFGKLNIICCTNDDEFALWVLGTRICSEKNLEEGRPIPKTEAKEILDDLRYRIGILAEHDSGPLDKRITDEIDA